ncbi:MAG: hypothetical protein E3K37_00615 [Candidatus Kuenenia sp.]|nr:hypothetical protein [Candidatus Kuenenia hertensis]
MKFRLIVLVILLFAIGGVTVLALQQRPKQAPAGQEGINFLNFMFGMFYEIDKADGNIDENSAGPYVATGVALELSKSDTDERTE